MDVKLGTRLFLGMPEQKENKGECLILRQDDVLADSEALR